MKPQLFGTRASELLSWMEGDEEDENEFQEGEGEEEGEKILDEKEKSFQQWKEVMKEEMKREQEHQQKAIRQLVVEKKEKMDEEEEEGDNGKWNLIERRKNIDKQACPICLCDDHRTSVYLPECQHHFCQTCFFFYLDVELQQPAEKSLIQNVVVLEKSPEKPNELNIRTATYGIKCPVSSCPFVLVPEVIRSFLKDSAEVLDALNSKLHQLHCERNAPLCPRCSSGTFLAAPGATPPPASVNYLASIRLTPPSYFCQNEKCRFHQAGGFCSECKKKAHPGEICKPLPEQEPSPVGNKGPQKPRMDPELARLSRFCEKRLGASGLFHWVVDKSFTGLLKPCPNCRNPIEKNGGCSHMHCTKCDTHFDWSQAVEFSVMESEVAKDFQRRMKLLQMRGFK